MGGHAFGALTDANGTASPPLFLPGIVGLEEPSVIPWGNGFLTVWKTWDYFQIVILNEHGVIERVSRAAVAWPYRSWKMASNGRQFLIVYQESVLRNACYASLYEPDGTLLARTGLPIDGVTNFAVARDHDSYVVVTGGYDGVHFFRIDNAGTIIADKELQRRPTEFSTRLPYVAVAVDATQALVAWTATYSTDAHVMTVSSSNDAGALQPLPVKDAGFPAIRAVPAASGCLILWSDETGHVSLLRTDAAGHIDAEPIQVATGDLVDAVAADDRFAAITKPARISSPVSIVIGTVLPQRVQTSVRTVVTSTAARQERPVIASDGVDYVSAWLEHDGSDVIAKIGRVTRAGVPLDGAGVTLPAPTKNVRDLSIARGAGGDALVVVSAAEGTWAFRWSRTAGLVDTAPIVLDSGTYYGNAVAWNGVSYLAVWSADSYSISLAGRFIGSDGVAGAKFTIPMTLSKDEPVFALNPAIGWDGRQFLVALPTASNVPCLVTCPVPQASEIRLVRLSAAGNAIDKTPYRLLNATSARVATSGGEFLLLVNDDYGLSGFSAVVVHAAASGLSASAPVKMTLDGGDFDVAWDGTYYDVPWPGIGGWLHLWRLDHSGHIVQKLFTAFPSSYAPSVTANDAGEVAIGVAEEAPPFGVSRARIYLGSELESVQPVLTAPTHAVSHLASLAAPYTGVTGVFATVTWDGDAPGFLVEELRPPYWYLLERVPGNRHETTIYTKLGAVIRIRAYGPDLSTPDGAITIVHTQPRTRAVGR
ncbi:MAG: hypothetical protein QOF63_474 [Thermoanaerobaculia bacterium]|nr:hypothetical protein [Thermoanaerobaculia bacterium]